MMSWKDVREKVRKSLSASHAAPDLPFTIPAFDLGTDESQSVSRLDDRKFVDRIIYADDLAALDELKRKVHRDMMQQLPQPRPIVMKDPNRPLSEISNAELVMEMLKRGYACMKLPEDGSLPQALKGAEVERGQSDR
jgi:hypothetical protein